MLNVLKISGKDKTLLSIVSYKISYINITLYITYYYIIFIIHIITLYLFSLCSKISNYPGRNMQNAAKKQMNVFECKSQRHKIRRNLRHIKRFIYCCHFLHSDQRLELATDFNMYISSIATDAEKKWSAPSTASKRDD